ncbi:hypothetical protein [Legionella cardiaca]|uniref:Uncharacterized protein n=1 Tax=Legionella cardiaca TaxID=1071983 RepID=A0ABY8AYT9_9GAMM|nr:hypothetical protein [Legionella cardiaca]WED44272.1 hypothetical protein PXX05_05660 [Legionella cardiaca]
MIDRLIAEDTELDLLKKLIKLHHETQGPEVKNKIVQGLMLYNQRHRKDKVYIYDEIKGLFK